MTTPTNSNPEQLWDEIVGVKDTDTVLNEIDSMIEEEEYTARVEGFLDLVEDAVGEKVTKQDIVRIANQLLAYAESQE